ncbi:MAG: transcription factor [Deltaproteobacteria bacterium]|nr:MAG: transcription factor [Deltaproteobacteria bacterium]
MPIPSILSVTPSSGPTAGRLLVELVGSGFQQQTVRADAVGRTAVTSPGVRVRIGDRAAQDVRVLAEDVLTCVVPAGDPGRADVVVQNLDATGAPVPGELAIARDVFAYVRQPLAVEADLTRLVRALLQELKRQVIDNVVLTVHTDFEADVGAELHLATIARLPALVLLGPELAEDRFFSLNQPPELATGPGQFVQRRVPYTVDLSFTVIGVSDHTTELLNLMAATQLFFHRNPYLALDRDPGDPDAGSVRYEMDVARDGDLRVTSQPNASNVRSFSGRAVVRGFDLEDLAGFPEEGAVARGAAAEVVVVPPAQPLRSTSAPGGQRP